MKFGFAIFILIAIPMVLFTFLLVTVLPLFIQHFFQSKFVSDAPVYPYLTSWEEAA